MSAPNTSQNSQQTTLTAAGRTAGNTHSLRQPQTKAELAQWICGLTIGGRNDPLTPQQLWATHDTLMWVQQTGVLGNPHHPLFTRIGTIRRQSAKEAHNTVVAGFDTYRRLLGKDAVTELRNRVADQLGQPRTDWQTISQVGTAINIVDHDAESQCEIVTRLWPTFSNEEVVLGAINSVLDNGTAPMNLYWNREAILSNYEDIKTCYRRKAQGAGLDVPDLCLVDTAPQLAPYITRACARNQTVREAFPVQTSDASLPAFKPEPTDPSPGSIKLEETRNGKVEGLDATPYPLRTDPDSLILPCKSPHDSEGSVAIKDEFEMGGSHR